MKSPTVRMMFIVEARRAFAEWLESRRSRIDGVDEKDLRELLDALSLVQSGTPTGYFQVIEELLEALDEQDPDEQG